MSRLIMSLILSLFLNSVCSAAEPIIREEGGKIIVEYQGTSEENPQAPPVAAVANPVDECRERLGSTLDQITKILTFYESDPKGELQYKLSQVEALLPMRDDGSRQFDALCKETTCEKKVVSSIVERIAKQNEAIKYLRTFAINAESIAIDDLKLSVLERNEYGTTFSYVFKVSNSGYPANIRFKLQGLDRDKFVLIEHLVASVLVPQDGSRTVSGKTYESTQILNRVSQWKIETDGVQRYNR